jgi:hypothetical protein
VDLLFPSLSYNEQVPKEDRTVAGQETPLKERSGVKLGQVAKQACDYSEEYTCPMFSYS